MSRLRTLLHDPGLRPRWRALLALLLVVISWLAFTPQPPTPGFDGADKINHLMAFAALAVVAGLASAPGRFVAWRIGAGLLGYGGFIESVQTLLPPRQGEWADLLADAAGIAAGLAVLALLRRRGHAGLH
ncbi:MAG: VanZ family protein [Rubrivivax sp.]|nr:VanZ family protein [Rubrivivax sp.]